MEATAERGQPVVHVIPLLVETGQADDFDLVVVVDLPLATQRARVLTRRLSRQKADQRIAAQASRDVRLAVADVVVDNSGLRDGLASQVDRLWRLISHR